MIEVLGNTYYMDLNELEKFVELPDEEVTKELEEGVEIEEDTKGQRFSIIKFEIVKTMIEVVLTEREEFDENLGSYQATKTSIPFRLAFNTLLRHNIIKSLD